MSAAAPDIAGTLAQLGAGGAAPPTQDGGQAPPAPPDPSTPSDPLDLVRQMIETGKTFTGVEPHQQHVSIMADVVARLQKMLAEDEKDTHDAFRGNISPRQLSRAAAGPGY